MPGLPIDPLLPAIVSSLRRSPNLVLTAPPGAGKTTRVPPAILEAGLGGKLEVIVLQPRRLPTRLAARRVAEEMGTALGGLVGYQVRFEDLSSAQTRIRFATEGVLERRLLSDPELSKASVVILDEFHERHLDGDLCLALLRRLQQSHRPDLRLVVMSATLEAEPIARFLGGCPVLSSEGRQYPVDVQHLAAVDPRPLEQQVLSALKKAGQAEGHILVFLPGAAEIRRTWEACTDFAQRHRIEIHALHGDLSPVEQDRAVRPSAGRKLILSTNVAQTSVTIEDTGTVIDSGMARIAAHSPWSGLPVLRLSKISKASAVQRAGRAGRTRAGVCLRLYTRQDFDSRPDHEAPEIERVDLAGAALGLHAMGSDLAQFPFFEPPPPAAIEAAQTLLYRLGALDQNRKITDEGRDLLRLPLHPRLAKLVLEGEKRGIEREATVIAAILGERDIRQPSHARLGRTDHLLTRPASSRSSDLEDLLERYEEAERAHFDARRLQQLSLDPSAARAVERIQRQLARGRSKRPTGSRSQAEVEEALMRCALAAFPDRVAKRRSERSRELLLSEGGTAILDETSTVNAGELLVAVDAEERTTPRGTRNMVRLASQIQPEWLIDLPNNDLRESEELEWNDQSARVERISRLTYGQLVLEETRGAAPVGERASAILCKAALAGRSKLLAPRFVEQWKARLECLAANFPDFQILPDGDALIDSMLKELCANAISFEQLQQLSPERTLLAAFAHQQARLYATMTPERISLPSGRSLEVHYQPGNPPWVESRLQDFFGMAQGPAICGGRVFLVLHLLAPNQRPVQVTSDLAGFWVRHYPAIRRELARKYPRHSWPDDPLHASPPPSRAVRK